ncbi:hypothetical protein PYW07_006445 [Mythimna separata]|uniref:Uncharacterized protein n=1 Tax=Mythimna separata TaxID=271217 RepID=A0AAD8DXN3_MYTSE|nr:hypothetical protein PYW07_006445 [Mythimna separata]
MWIVVLLLTVLCSTSLLVNGFGNDWFIGKGQWQVKHIEECEKPEQYPHRIQINRRKINRTHDAFNAHIVTTTEINDTFGVQLVLYKEVDGGFRLIQQISNGYLCTFGKSFAGRNIQMLFEKAGIDPPDCPIPAGEYTIEDFVIDYRPIMSTSLYGDFQTYTYITYRGKRVACGRTHCRFERTRQDEDDGNDDEYEDY